MDLKTSLRNTLLLAATLCVAFLASCDIMQPPKLVASSYAMSASELNLQPGESRAVSVNVAPNEVKSKVSYRWKSSDTSVVTINPQGDRAIVSAKTAGTAFITVDSPEAEGAATSCVVTVAGSGTGGGGVGGADGSNGFIIYTNNTTLSGVVGKSIPLSVSLVDALNGTSASIVATQGISYTSSNPSVVKPFGTGSAIILDALSVGEASVTISHPKAASPVQVSVRVVSSSGEIGPPAIKVSSTIINIKTGDSLLISGSVEGGSQAVNNATNWFVNDPSVVKLVGVGAQVQLTGLKAGTSYIQVSNPGTTNTATITVTVGDSLVTGGSGGSGSDKTYVLSTQSTNLSLTSGVSRLLSVTMAGAASTEYTGITYQSSNTAVLDFFGGQASVTLRPGAVGDAVLTINHPKAVAPLYVYVSVVSSSGSTQKTISTSQQLVKMTVGADITINATLEGGTASEQNGLQWVIADTSVLSGFGGGGVYSIRGLKSGQTTITVRSAVDPGVSALIYVQVTDSSTGSANFYLSTSSTNLSAKMGTNFSITAQLTGGATTAADQAAIQWTSSDPAKLQIYGSGSGSQVLLIPKAEGIVILTASHAKSIAPLTIYVTINNSAAANNSYLQTAQTYISMTPGQTLNFGCSIVNAQSPLHINDTVWTVSNNVVSVLGSGGSVQITAGAAAGEATLLIYNKNTTNQTLTIPIKVQSAVQTISLSSNNISMSLVGSTPTTKTLTATISNLVSASDYDDIIWTVNTPDPANPLVAIVGSGGGAASTTARGQTISMTANVKALGDASSGSGSIVAMLPNGRFATATFTVSMSYYLEVNDNVTMVEVEPFQTIRVPVSVWPLSSTLQFVSGSSDLYASNGITFDTADSCIVIKGNTTGVEGADTLSIRANGLSTTLQVKVLYKRSMSLTYLGAPATNRRFDIRENPTKDIVLRYNMHPGTDTINVTGYTGGPNGYTVTVTSDGMDPVTGRESETGTITIHPNAPGNTGLLPLTVTQVGAMYGPYSATSHAVNVDYFFDYVLRFGTAPAGVATQSFGSVPLAEKVITGYFSPYGVGLNPPEIVSYDATKYISAPIINADMSSGIFTMRYTPGNPQGGDSTKPKVSSPITLRLKNGNAVAQGNATATAVIGYDQKFDLYTNAGFTTALQPDGTGKYPVTVKAYRGASQTGNMVYFQYWAQPDQNVTPIIISNLSAGSPRYANVTFTPIDPPAGSPPYLAAGIITFTPKFDASGYGLEGDEVVTITIEGVTRGFSLMSRAGWNIVFDETFPTDANAALVFPTQWPSVYMAGYNSSGQEYWKQAMMDRASTDYRMGPDAKWSGGLFQGYEVDGTYRSTYVTNFKAGPVPALDTGSGEKLPKFLVSEPTVQISGSNFSWNQLAAPNAGVAFANNSVGIAGPNGVGEPELITYNGEQYWSASVVQYMPYMYRGSNATLSWLSLTSDSGGTFSTTNAPASQQNSIGTDYSATLKYSITFGPPTSSSEYKPKTVAISSKAGHKIPNNGVNGDPAASGAGPWLKSPTNANPLQKGLMWFGAVDSSAGARQTSFVGFPGEVSSASFPMLRLAPGAVPAAYMSLNGSSDYFADQVAAWGNGGVSNSYYTGYAGAKSPDVAVIKLVYTPVPGFFTPIKFVHDSAADNALDQGYVSASIAYDQSQAGVAYLTLRGLKPAATKDTRTYVRLFCAGIRLDVAVNTFATSGLHIPSATGNSLGTIYGTLNAGSKLASYGYVLYPALDSKGNSNSVVATGAVGYAPATTSGTVQFTGTYGPPTVFTVTFLAKNSDGAVVGSFPYTFKSERSPALDALYGPKNRTVRNCQQPHSYTSNSHVHNDWSVDYSYYDGDNNWITRRASLNPGGVTLEGKYDAYDRNSNGETYNKSSYPAPGWTAYYSLTELATGSSNYNGNGLVNWNDEDWDRVRYAYYTTATDVYQFSGGNWVHVNTPRYGAWMMLPPGTYYWGPNKEYNCTITGESY